jgi:hypothetical protein
VSPSLTVAHVTEERIGTNTYQVPLPRCETILVSIRRSLARELRRNYSTTAWAVKLSVAHGSATHSLPWTAEWIRTFCCRRVRIGVLV